jgi:DNA-binding CsgD family transcriptional regulator
MRRWKIKQEPGMIDATFVTDVIAGIGTDALAARFLAAMQRKLSASHCTVFALEASGRVHAISTASAYGVVASITAEEYHRHRFDALDNNMVWMARKRTPLRAQTWMSHQFAEDVRDQHYRDLCYTQPGIRERTSVLLLSPEGLRIAVSFYRNLAYAPFNSEEFATIAHCAPVLHEAVMAHARKTSPALARDSLHQQVLTLLASRERQVMTYVLAGKTTREIAELLDVSPTTVLTYRYRAFAKLGVRSQRDLMAILNRVPLVR